MTRTMLPPARPLRLLPACLLALALLGRPDASWAYEFWPSAQEWAWWPEYCRARYVSLPIGQNSEYGSMVSGTAINGWRNRLGPVWVFVHHHCAGAIWLQRAKLSTNERDRKFALKQAIAESRFTLDRIPADHPMYAEILTHMGMVERESGNPVAALNYFDRAVTGHPGFAGGYQGQALVHRDQGRLERAREVLIAGDEATGGESAEIAYFLGLVLVDLKDYESARDYAQRAYALGYPLPGLRDKLARVGYALPQPQSGG